MIRVSLEMIEERHVRWLLMLKQRSEQEMTEVDLVRDVAGDQVGAEA